MKQLFLFLLLAFFPLLFSCNVVEHDGEPRGNSIGVANVDGSGFKTLANGINPQITPDSKKVIFSDVEKGLYSIGIDGNSMTCIYEKSSIYDFRLSPDGKKIAFTSDSSQTINLMNTDGSGFIQLYESKSQKNILYFSNGGSSIYFTELDPLSFENRNLSSVDLNGNYKLLSTDTSYGGFGGDPQVTPDGNNVIFFKRSGNNPHLLLRNLNTQIDNNMADCAYLEDVAIKPANFISQSTFLYVYKRTLYSYDLLSGAKQSYITIPNNYYFYSPDGQKMVYSIGSGKIEVANIDGTAKTEVTVPSSASTTGTYLISPDNRKVIFSIINKMYF